MPRIQTGTPNINPAQPIGPIASTIATRPLKAAHQRGRTRVRHATTATAPSGTIAASSAPTKNTSIAWWNVAVEGAMSLLLIAPATSTAAISIPSEAAIPAPTSARLGSCNRPLRPATKQRKARQPSMNDQPPIRIVLVSDRYQRRIWTSAAWSPGVLWVSRKTPTTQRITASGPVIAQLRLSVG